MTAACALSASINTANRRLGSSASTFATGRDVKATSPFCNVDVYSERERQL